MPGPHSSSRPPGFHLKCSETRCILGVRWIDFRLCVALTDQFGVHQYTIGVHGTQQPAESVLVGNITLQDYFVFRNQALVEYSGFMAEMLWLSPTSGVSMPIYLIPDPPATGDHDGVAVYHP